MYRVQRYRQITLPDERLEVLAMLASDADARTAEGPLRLLAVCRGFDGASHVENRVADGQYDLVGTTRFDRVIEALQALTESQRAALELSAARLAALAMLDELRGMYATGELAAARRMSERCLRDLEDAFGRVAPHDEAALKRPIVRTHDELGRLCEQAIATFLNDTSEALGRVRQLCYVAAELGGGELAPFETRSDRGRRTAFASVAPEGFEMIELPYGVVHPTRWPEVAERLGLTVAEARARLYPREDDSDDEHPYGPRGNAAAIGEDLLVRAIPVIPEHERPTLYFPRGSAVSGTTERADPLTSLYDHVRGYVERARRFGELGAADVLYDVDSAAVQRLVDRLAERAAPIDISAIDGWGPMHVTTTEVPLAYEGHHGSSVSDHPPSCVWLADDRIAVARADMIYFVSLGEQSVFHTEPLPYARLQACDDTGRYLVTTGYTLSVDRNDIPECFGCYDIEAGTWLDALPAHIPAVTFGKDQPEDGQLFELRRDAGFTIASGDRPTAMCWARGNRAVLVSGDYESLYHAGIRSTVTCFEEVSGDVLERRAEVAPVLGADGELEEREVDDGELVEEDWPRYEAVPCAIANLGGGRWRCLLPTLHVADLDRTLFQLGFPIRAASFSPDGARLAVLAGDELRIIDIDARTIVARVEV